MIVDKDFKFTSLSFVLTEQPESKKLAAQPERKFSFLLKGWEQICFNYMQALFSCSSFSVSNGEAGCWCEGGKCVLFRGACLKLEFARSYFESQAVDITCEFVTQIFLCLTFQPCLHRLSLDRSTHPPGKFILCFLVFPHFYLSWHGHISANKFSACECLSVPALREKRLLLLGESSYPETCCWKPCHSWHLCALLGSEGLCCLAIIEGPSSSCVASGFIASVSETCV